MQWSPIFKKMVGGGRKTLTNRHKQTQTDTDRHRQTHTQTQTQTQKQTERHKQTYYCKFSRFSDTNCLRESGLSSSMAWTDWTYLEPCPPPRPPPRPSPCLPAGPFGVLLACSAALSLHTYDNTLGDSPPDTLGLTILIPSERGCVNNPGHKHNKSPYSWEVDWQIFTSPRYGEVDRQIGLSYFRRADLPSLWISLLKSCQKLFC